MASEIEEPFRLNFQADSLHSGSISFGRFESEALCWERRSSFSHNRYLEEVEKCSKPGSVIEKKAYFEAHFRKKGILGILGQSSPDSQNETEYQTSGNDTSESSYHNGESVHVKVENHSDSAHFDESPIVTLYDVENEMAQFEREVFGDDVVPENVGVEDLQSTVRRDLITSNFMPGNGMKENFDGKEVKFDTIGDFTDNNEAEENSDASNIKDEQASSSKEFVQAEDEHTKPRLMSRLGLVKSRRYISYKEVKGPKNKLGDNINDFIRRPKTDMKNSESSVLNKYQMYKTPKHEPGSRTKGINGIRSTGKESGDRALIAPQSSTIKKASTRLRQTAIRANPASGETKLGMKDSSGFCSKHSEPSLRKGEFGVSLKEKVHNKEAKTYKLHVKNEEKKSEITQLSKSLNFKAKPMPSFYHRAALESDRNKTAVSSVKPRRPQTNFSVAGTRVRDRTTLSTKKGTQKTSDPAEHSGAMSCHSTVTSDSNPPSPAAAEITFRNHLSLGDIKRQHKVPEVNQVNKGNRTNVKEKTRTGRTTTTSIPFKK